jgi:F-type H+-transporting ATPase subunit a
LVIKPSVLAIRLFANMLAGHTVLLVFLSLGFIIYSSNPDQMGMAAGLGAASWVIGVAFYALELLVALIQAYIFTLLSAVFIGSCIHPSH